MPKLDNTHISYHITELRPAKNLKVLKVFCIIKMTVLNQPALTKNSVDVKGLELLTDWLDLLRINSLNYAKSSPDKFFLDSIAVSFQSYQM